MTSGPNEEQVNFNAPIGTRERLRALAFALGYVNPTRPGIGNIAGLITALSKAPIEDVLASRSNKIVRVPILTPIDAPAVPAELFPQPKSLWTLPAPAVEASDFPPPFRLHNEAKASKAQMVRRPRTFVCHGKCGRRLPYTVSYFALHRRNKTGLAYECLECNRAAHHRNRGADKTPAAPAATPFMAPAKPKSSGKARAAAAKLAAPPLAPTPATQPRRKRGWLHRLLYGNYENVG